MTVLVVTGTGTEIGKTVVTAAVAACALRAGRVGGRAQARADRRRHPDERGDAAEAARLRRVR